MTHGINQIVGGGLLMAGMLAAGGCEPKRIPTKTVVDLMEDRVTLDGVLLKCNESLDKARNAADCLNARIAIERLAKDVDPTVAAKRDAEFEHSREQLRQAQERMREDQESKAKVDPYNLPVVPVDVAPSSISSAHANADPTMAGQSKP